MNAPPEQDLADLARRIVDGNAYMTLATADGAGRPWASPVWYAPGGHGELLWVSDPEARHSRNLAVRPQVGIVIFDSTVPIGGAQAVYMEALAEEVPDADLERAIGIFSRRSEAQEAAAWTAAEVRSAARERLYHAVASERFVLGPGSRRLRVI